MNVFFHDAMQSVVDEALGRCMKNYANLRD